MQNWQEIWSQEQKVDNAVLEMLIRLSGFYETGFTNEKWLNYARFIAEKMNINGSLFEVGCGCGALLYAMKQLNIQIGGD